MLIALHLRNIHRWVARFKGRTQNPRQNSKLLDLKGIYKSRVGGGRMRPYGHGWWESIIHKTSSYQGSLDSVAGAYTGVSVLDERLLAGQRSRILLPSSSHASRFFIHDHRKYEPPIHVSSHNNEPIICESCFC